MRGSNRAIYYGDVFSSSSAQASLDTNEYFQYSGGFKFSKSIATAAEVASSDLTTPVLPGDVTTVPFVDLSRYVGKWYEMASFPQSFQRGCVASTADYSLNSDGKTWGNVINAPPSFGQHFSCGNCSSVV